MKNKKIFTFLAVAALVIMPMVVLAQSTINPKVNPLGFLDPTTGAPVPQHPVTDLGAIVITLVNWFAWLIGVAAVIMGLYSGFLFITARGETSQLSTARKTLLYAIIGIAVAVFSFSIVAVTKSFLP